MLYKRSNIYYFRWQVPHHLRPHIGSREVVRSLRTNDKLEANLLCSFFEQRQQLTIKAYSLYAMKQLDEAGLAQAIKSLWTLTEETDYSITSLPHLLDVQISSFEEHRAAVTEILRTYQFTAKLKSHSGDFVLPSSPRGRLETIARKWLINHGFNSWTESQLEELINELTKVIAVAAKKELDSLNQVAAPSYNSSNLPSSVPAPCLPQSTNKTIKQLWEEYCDEKIASGSWKNSQTIQEITGQLEDTLDILGIEDIQMEHFTRDHAKKVRDGLKKYPAYRRSRYGDTPLSEIPTDAASIELRTVNNRLTNLSTFFIWAKAERYTSYNPFERLQVKAPKRNYASFTSQDLKEVLNLPPKRILHAWHFWIPRIAALTGARQGEIAQLLIQDVKQDEDSIWYFNLTDADISQSIKSEAGRRPVPIHKDLIEHGFLVYLDKVKKLGTTSLWPKLNAKSAKAKLATGVSDYWNRLKTVHGIPSNPLNDKGESKVFHSFRRISINQLKRAGVPLNEIQTLVGHEKTDLGSTLSYLDDMELSDLQEIANKVHIPEINWEHPKKYDV